MSCTLEHRKIVLVLVFCSYYVDNVLMTVIVPIIPDVLYRQMESKGNASQMEWNSLEQENGKIGLLFASKAIVQLIVNPIIGSLTNKYGCKLFMVMGSVIFVLSCVMFATSSSYGVLITARSIHGVGSACSIIGGMAMLAKEYQNDDERSKATGLALGGMAVGVLMGYPLGGVMYQFFGPSSPFIIIASIALVTSAGQLCILTENKILEPQREKMIALELLRDKPILISLLSIGLSTMSIATMEACLPIWMRRTMHPTKWQIGTAFVPDSVGYLIGTNLFGHVALRIGRWKCATLSMIGIGLGLFLLPFANKISHLILPHFIIGLGVATVDASLLPLLALCVDTDHNGVYGSVFALSQTTVSLAYALGPFIGGWLLAVIGFPVLLRSLALIIVCYAPINYLLRDCNHSEEHQFPEIMELQGSKELEAYWSRVKQSTRHVVARTIIPQLLDEVMWRERFGRTSREAWRNILLCLGSQ